MRRLTPAAVAAGLQDRFTSPHHSEAVAARLGVALGVTFTICALTGGFSHLLQHEPPWLDVPSRPAGLYRVTQGLHVLTGMASIPLLLAKLWTVAPKLVEWPVVRSPAHGIERLALLPLVGGGIFLLLSGVANVARWYPWSFFFPQAHLWAAWITMGALVAHVGATWTVSRAELRRSARPPIEVHERKDRRAFLGGVALTSGIVVLASAGSTIPWTSPLSFLAQRRLGTGPQGLPVNKTAAQADVVEAATDDGWRLTLRGPSGTRILSLADLRAMPQREAVLPIACVEGWSASAGWRGVPVRDLLDLVDGPPGAEVMVRSLQRRGDYNHSELNRYQSDDRDTLLALELNGEVLHLDHGFPARLIGPNRPGVAQTKWVSHIEVR